MKVGCREGIREGGEVGAEVSGSGLEAGGFEAKGGGEGIDGDEGFRGGYVVGVLVVC